MIRFQYANSKGVDQTLDLSCSLQTPKAGFLASRPHIKNKKTNNFLVCLHISCQDIKYIEDLT